MAEYEAKRASLPFLTAKTRLKDEYGIHMEEHDYIEAAYYIWRDLGNIAVDIKRLLVTVPADRIIKLPESCEFVDKVHTTLFRNDVIGAVDYSSHNFDSEGRVGEFRPTDRNLSIEKYIKDSDNMLYGEAIAYSLAADNTLIINNITLVNHQVAIIYYAIAVDTQGLPMLNDKETKAIAMSLALRNSRKQMFMGNPKAAQLVDYLEPRVPIAMASASFPEKLSSNFMDKLLDIRNSWDRKTFGKTFTRGI